MKPLEDVVAELLSKVMDYRADYEKNEFEVRQHLINPLLDALGWSSSDPKRVRHNYSTEDKDIPDSAPRFAQFKD